MLVQLRLRHAVKVLIDTYLSPNVEVVAEVIKSEMLDLPAIFLRKNIEELVGAIQELQEELVQIDEHTKKDFAQHLKFESDLAFGDCSSCIPIPQETPQTFWPHVSVYVTGLLSRLRTVNLSSMANFLFVVLVFSAILQSLHSSSFVVKTKYFSKRCTLNFFSDRHSRRWYSLQSQSRSW